MSYFNAFIGGAKEGRAALQRRQSDFNAAMMPDVKPQVQTPMVGQATANRGRVQNVGAAKSSGAHGQVELRSETQNLARSLAGLDPAKRIELKAELKRKGQIIAALSPLPPEQKVIGIQTFGKEFGIDAAALQKAEANPDMALAEFSSSVQQAETMLEQVSSNMRQNPAQRNDPRISNPRDLSSPETPVTLMAQVADVRDTSHDPYAGATPSPQIPVNMGGPMTVDSSKLLGPIDLTGSGEENSVDRFFKEAAKGLGDAGAAPPAVILHKARLKAKQPRAIFVQRAIESGISFGAENPDIAYELGLDTIKSNPGRFTGRVLGGSAMSLAGNKGTKTVLKKAGKSKKAQSRAGAAASVSIFSTSQYGAAIRGVQGLIDDLEDAGADVSEISTGTIGKAAIAAAAGGELSYDVTTGDIILLNPGVEGSVSGEVVLGNLKRRE